MNISKEQFRVGADFKLKVVSRIGFFSSNKYFDSISIIERIIALFIGSDDLLVDGIPTDIEMIIVMADVGVGG